MGRRDEGPHDRLNTPLRAPDPTADSDPYNTANLAGEDEGRPPIDVEQGPGEQDLNDSSPRETCNGLDVEDLENDPAYNPRDPSLKRIKGS